ncbi:EscU/YscU/HrcU family type III secretion system export apparatus switch protein [Burkholderia sp. WSM2232]|uniref:EscU/YscU/HrcU family type III secretion system export apparatus switch protein n=1 Tax=Burkholderia sp. WSM2232 TaxID=944436 RepID=UPI00041141D9|nr:EscU/YscU/HrcU family type III secretion system export apparatus switch protein [Burkholderia sp. WSM2232]
MSEKTEQPTEKKRRDARQKGQVAKSVDLTTCVQLVVVLAFFWFGGPAMWKSMQDMVVVTVDSVNLPVETAGNQIRDAFFALSLQFLAPLCGILLVSSVASIVAQVGVVISPEALSFKVDKLNPVNNARQFVSIKRLIEFAKSLLKCVVVTAIFYYLMRSHLGSLQFLSLAGAESGVRLTARLVQSLWAALIVVYILIGGLDFAWQRFQLTRDLKMSRDEVQREYKDTDGNPEIKRKRKEVHRDIQGSNLASNVKKSSVLVRNPTHIAVCLYYKPGETPLPQILEMGVDDVAKRMVQIAAAAGVPMVEHVAVARTLYAGSEVGDYIPTALFDPVAQILQAVGALDGNENDEGINR